MESGHGIRAERGPGFVFLTGLGSRPLFRSAEPAGVVGGPVSPSDITTSTTYTLDDAAGRTTGVTLNNQTTTIAYDYESRITQITYPNSSTNAFAYNALDTRVGKVDSGGTKTFKRDGAGATDLTKRGPPPARPSGVTRRRRDGLLRTRAQ